MDDPKQYQFDLPQRNRPQDVVISDPWYPGVQAYWDRCTTKRSVDPIYGIRAVVIHATAGASSAGAVSVMKRREDPASFHWLVPDEDEAQHGHLVWACVPEALAAWHVRNLAKNEDVNGGAGRVNHWSLGIEIVNAQKEDAFSAWQIEATARVVRYCWAKYPNLRHIVSHAKLDPKRRSDPGKHFDWDRFKSLVLEGGDDEVPALVAQVAPLSRLRSPAAVRCCDGPLAAH